MERPAPFILAVCFLQAFVWTSCASKQNEPQTEKRTGETASSTQTVPDPTAPPATADKRPLIVAFGDSLTAGVAGRSYPDQLQDVLDQRGYAYRVENQGVSGDTSTDGLARIDNVVANKPALVVLEFGGNDGLRGIPVEATRKNLSEMMEKLKAARIPFVLLGITLPPNYGPDYVKPFTAMFPELAKQYHVPFVPFLLQHVYQHPELMQPDGIHPNGAGNRIVAADVFDLIRPMLSK